MEQGNRRYETEHRRKAHIRAIRGDSEEIVMAALVADGVQWAEFWARLRAKAGGQCQMESKSAGLPALDPGFRRDDDQEVKRLRSKSTVSTRAIQVPVS